MDFIYCDTETGCEFDVREFPAKYVSDDLQLVLEGEREEHKAVICRAIDNDHDFQRRKD